MLVQTMTYLAIGVQDVLILAAEFVDHLNNVGNACMMQPEPAVLSPRVSLSRRSFLHVSV